MRKGLVITAEMVDWVAYKNYVKNCIEGIYRKKHCVEDLYDILEFIDNEEYDAVLDVYSDEICENFLKK